MEPTDILRYPKTNNRLHFEGAAATVHVGQSNVTYPVIGGIIDFCPESHDKIAGSYDRVASRNDPYINADMVAELATE